MSTDWPELDAVLAGESDGCIITADCLEVMKQMPDGSVDAVVTDPPWMDYETGWYAASQHHRPVAVVSPAQWVPAVASLPSAPAAAMCWCRWDSFAAHANEFVAAGWVVRNQFVWAKPNHTAGDLEGNAGFQHECAVFAVHGAWKHGGQRETNLWHEPHLFSRGFRHHPTEKPRGLMERCIRWVGGDVILDPFCGSGTTCVAAKKLGRRWVGIEIDEKYAAIARSRVANTPKPLFVEEPAPPKQLPLLEPEE